MGWEIGKMGFGGFDVGKLVKFLGFVMGDEGKMGRVR